MRKTWSHFAGFEEVEKCRQLLEARKGKKMDSLLEHPERTQPANTFDFSPMRFSSHIHNCKRINLYGFRH